MDKTKEISQPIQEILAQIDAQIATHERAIANLKLSRQMWIDEPPQPVGFVRKNSPLTRDLIRNVLKGYGQPVQTVQLIDILYSDITAEEKSKLVKTLSVIFNQMEKEGEVTIEKRPGVKGNFYKWVAKIV